MPTLTAPTLGPSLVPPRPLAPLSGAIVDASAATFSWEAVPGARAYRLQIAPDRQFARAVLELDAGPSTQLALFQPLSAQDGPLFWRVRAKTENGWTRWSAYGRFTPGGDDAVDAYNAQQEAARLAALKRQRQRAAEEAAARDLVPYWQQEGAPKANRLGIGVGLIMIVSFVVTMLLIVLATMAGA